MKITDNIAISNAKPVQINNNVLNNRIKNYIQDIPQDSFVKATPTEPTKPQNVSFGCGIPKNVQRILRSLKKVRLVVESPDVHLYQKAPVEGSSNIDELVPPCYDLIKMELSKDGSKVIYKQDNRLRNIKFHRDENSETGIVIEGTTPVRPRVIKRVIACKPRNVKNWNVARLLEEYKENPTLENAAKLIKAIDKN